MIAKAPAKCFQTHDEVTQALLLFFKTSFTHKAKADSDGEPALLPAASSTVWDREFNG